jgi:hypothetical protein
MKRDIRIVAEPTYEEIACLAYRFFEEGGCRHGHDVEDWLQAQAHLSTDQKHSVLGLGTLYADKRRALIKRLS